MKHETDYADRDHVAQTPLSNGNASRGSVAPRHGSKDYVAPAALLVALDGLSSDEGSEATIRALDALIASGALNLPYHGSGRTIVRFAALSEIAARDLSLARLAEGHADALSILAEARHSTRGGSYGVWAGEPCDARVVATRTTEGWVLSGRTRYAAGATGLHRALVAAQAPDGGRLFDVDVRGARVHPVDGTWNAVGMAATDSLDVVFDDVVVRADDAIGEPGFHLHRLGFWQGAIGVAACWYGGALGAYRLLRKHLARGANDHQAAHFGAVAAACAMMQSMLADAAHAIDDHPANLRETTRTTALTVMHVVEQGCQEVLLRCGRAAGSSPLVSDRLHARRTADLPVYLRQHHAERDLADLGRAVLAVPKSDEPVGRP